jgi:tetratricopeptide (TPR) repeat protein
MIREDLHLEIPPRSGEIQPVIQKTRLAPTLCLLVALCAASAAAGCRSTPKPEGEAPAGGAAGGAPSGEQGQAQGGAGLSQDAEHASLAQQRRTFLVQQHLATGRQLLKDLRLDDAVKEADAALELEPDSLEAKNLRSEALAMKGQSVAQQKTLAEEMTERQALRVQQMRAETQDSIRKAKLMIARSDYTGAIAELEIANNLVQYAPFSIDWQGLDVEAKTLLESAKATRAAADAASEEQKQRKAYEALQAEEQTARDRKAALVASTIDRAISAFRAGEYEDAEAIAKQALDKDPHNAQAIEIRDAAFRAGRTKVREDYVDRKNEQFRRWQETIKEMQIPYVGVITEPDADQWNQISAMRAKRRGLDLSQKVPESEKALREQLHTTTLQMPEVKDQESLTKVMDIVKTITGLPIVVDPAAEAAATTGGVVFNFNFENKLTAEQALNLITKMVGDAVTWTVRHDVVLVTTKEKARGKPIIVNHDVQDIVFGLTDFLGPRIDQLRLLDKMQDEDGGGPFGAVLEKKKMIEPADLATLIQENVAVGTWQDEGVSIDVHEGYILINHVPEVQEQVRQFLEDLRRFGSSLVTIESKFMTVGSNWIQEIGVDFRGLDNQNVNDVTNGLEDMASRGLDNGGTGTSGSNASGHPSAGIFYDDGADGDFRATTQNFFASPLGSTLSTIGGLTFQITSLEKLNLSAILRAVEKSATFELVNDQVLSVHNTQRAYVQVINQRAYIQDFDVEVAQFQAVADPQVNVLHEGVVLDVRPTIHTDRRTLTLEIQPTVAKVVALRDFSSTLGGNTSPVTFQLPELQVQSVFTTATIPDGGSLLLGGLSNVRNIERRAEVPWFAKIPIIGFFFKQEGYDDENKSLLILIRARITDVRDELRKLERQ